MTEAINVTPDAETEKIKTIVRGLYMRPWRQAN